MKKSSVSKSDESQQLTIEESYGGVAETTEEARWTRGYARVFSTRLHAGVGRIDSRRDQPEVAAPPPERLYPHLYDGAVGTAATALRLVDQAKSDAQAAADSYSAGDLQGVSSRLALIAAAMASAHAHTGFNECFGSVVSHARRAVLRADAAEVSLPQIITLVKTLRALFESPLIGLGNAAELIDGLESAGWSGENEEVRSIISALLREGQGVHISEVALHSDSKV